MVRAKYAFVVAGFLAAAGIARTQTAVWVGGSSQSFKDPTNWQAGAPANNGSETLVVTSTGNTVMDIDNGTGADFSDINVNQGGVLTITGTNALTLDSLSGINLSLGGNTNTSNLTIDVPLVLTTNENWALNNQGGNLIVSGAITGNFSLNINGSALGTTSNVVLNSASSTFSGGIEFSGHGSVLAIGASSTGSGDAPTEGPLGTGTVNLDDGTQFNSPLTSATTIDNTFVIGDGSNGFPVVIGGQGASNNPLSTILTFTGTVYINDATTEIDLGPNSQINFNGEINGYSGNALTVGNIGVGNSLAIFRGDFQGVPTISLTDSSSVIFDGNPASQLSGVGSILTSDGGGHTYVGVGSGSDSDGYNEPTDVATFITKLGGSSFEGTLGFDTTTSNTFTFDDLLNLSTLTNPNFVGIGSATTAILGADALITPPGLTPAAQTTYLFGGGGGTLTVQAPLGDDTVNMVTRSLSLVAGNSPLTLVLNGPLTYGGGTSVDGAVLIFDTAPPANQVQLGFGTTKSGYLGNTTNAGYEDTDITNFLQIANINPAAPGGIVVGFDDITGDKRVVQNTTIDTSLLPTNTYFGTATSVEFTETVAFEPNSANQYKFAAVKGGYVMVDSDLSGTSSVVIGLPKPLESYSLSNGFVTISNVELDGDNAYTGGTTLNSGYLYVANDNSLGGGGSGALTVPDPGYGRDGWIASLNTINTLGFDVTLPNDIVLGSNGIALNFGNTQSTLTLAGVISDVPGDHAQLGIFGMVDLTGANTFSGGTTLGAGGHLAVENASALGTGDLSVYSSSGTPSTLTVGPGVPNVSIGNEIVLNNALLTLNDPGSSKDIALTGNITDLGTDGSIAVYGTAEFYGTNTYAGGTTLNHALVIVNNPESLGTGRVDFEGGSTLDTFASFTLPNPIYAGASMSLTGTNYELTLSGAISGSGPITINGPTEFSGDNSSYTGTVLFNDGTLMLSNSNALGTSGAIISSGGTIGINTGITVSSPITLDQGGKIAGYGSLAPSSPTTFAITEGTIISGGGGTSALFSNAVPKPIPGTLSLSSNANLSFGPNGVLQFSIDSQFGTAGTDYSAINSAGTLDITAAPGGGNQFIIQLVAVDPGTKQLGNPTFNSTLPSSWVLISTAGITNYGINDFTFDTASFGNGNFDPSTFSVTQSGNDLVLNFTPVPEPATWAMMASGAMTLIAAVHRRRRR